VIRLGDLLITDERITSINIQEKCKCCPHMFDYECRIKECPYKDVERIFEDLIKEAKENPDWKAINALQCAKKQIIQTKRRMK
jgi:hypothetical protein